MNRLEDLQTLIRLLNEFELPISPVLEYAIKEKEEELRLKEGLSIVRESTQTIDDQYSLQDTDSIKEEFSRYLYKEKSAGTARNYLRYIDKYVRSFINDIVDAQADSIYSFTTTTDAGLCILKLQLNEKFRADNQKWHNALTASLNSYVHFLERKEKS